MPGERFRDEAATYHFRQKCFNGCPGLRANATRQDYGLSDGHEVTVQQTEAAHPRAWARRACLMPAATLSPVVSRSSFWSTSSAVGSLTIDACWR